MQKFRETLIKIFQVILEFLKFWEKKDKQEKPEVEQKSNIEQQENNTQQTDSTSAIETKTE